MLTNHEFLSAIFGQDLAWCHVTDFPYDPGNIPKDKHLIAWKGDYYSRYNLKPGTNQYFTISTFYADNEQQARRRKALYRHTPCIVLDDVKEKLSMDEVSKLPSPSWILETSLGSEQWGYILDQPCTDRSQVENLLDGLVANGLAPQGRDPGMKGVTRYVRLPEGTNNKAAKLVNGQPFKCHMVSWQPFSTVTLEQLAAPFSVDLNAVRREARVDGATDVSDHPLVNIPDIIHIKEIRSDGRFDVTCPWVTDHTGGDDSGSAVFTNGDNSIGFKCHHGNCQSRTGADLLRYIEGASPGFREKFESWKIVQSFADVSSVTFLDQSLAPMVTESVTSFIEPEGVTPLAPVAVTSDGLTMLVDALRRERPDTAEARATAAQLLKAVDSLPKIDRNYWHDQCRDLMDWNQNIFKEILNDLRKNWYGEKTKDQMFYNDVIFIKEQNQFYDFSARIFYTPEAFQNSYAHEDAEARKIALQDGRVAKVDKLDYAPKNPRIFIEDGITYGNTWVDNPAPGTPGDAEPWLKHFEVMGWEEHRDHILKWMAFTILHPDQKINHMLLLGSGEGCGKDFLLYPLMRAMGHNSEVISGEELLESFNEYILSTKYLHINEAELGDRREALAVSNKLKPLAAAPPETLRVNPKGVKAISVRNIINATMTTNSQLPLRLNGPSRRFYACWSDMNPRDENEQMKPEWMDYWEGMWNWMKGGGADICIHYLRNHVDLSDFSPAAAPKMTEFLRDIREQSKSPAQQTLEVFIRKRIASFKCDLLTSADMSETLRAGALVAEADMYQSPIWFTPTRVGMLLREMPQIVKFNSYKQNLRVRLWAVRNPDKYRAMDIELLYGEYERQMLEARSSTPLTIVK